MLGFAFDGSRLCPKEVMTVVPLPEYARMVFIAMHDDEKNGKKPAECFKTPWDYYRWYEWFYDSIEEFKFYTPDHFPVDTPAALYPFGSLPYDISFPTSERLKKEKTPFEEDSLDWESEDFEEVDRDERSVDEEDRPAEKGQSDRIFDEKHKRTLEEDRIGEEAQLFGEEDRPVEDPESSFDEDYLWDEVNGLTFEELWLDRLHISDKNDLNEYMNRMKKSPIEEGTSFQEQDESDVDQNQSIPDSGLDTSQSSE